MKNAFLDKAKSQIPQIVRANLRKTLALCSAVLALTAIYALPFTAAKASGVTARTETKPIVVASPSAEVSAAPRAAAAQQRTDQVRVPLKGWVDMHTHPMSHLGFGKKLMHGAPDVDMIVPKGTYHCNKDDFRAQTMAEAMGSCASTHGGWGLFDNPCGDHLRAFMINAFIDDKFAWKLPPEQNLHLDHEHEGYPTFKYWPHQTSKLHQQMWYEWIKRAHEGGLNVMVALSVNSQLLANAINGDSPTLDRASSDLQITEIKRFVKRHADFMEIAFSSADLRRIVGAGKLAVILGMEIDDFGGFAQMGTVFKNQTHTMQRAQVKAEIKRVYDQGVRYLFPIHLSNNVFGGSAVYSSIFNFANKHNTGSFMDITTSPDPAIQYNLNFLNAGTPLVLSMVPGVYDAIAGFPAPCFGSGIPGTVGSCSPALGIIKDAVTADGKWVNYQSVVPGHINDQGLTPLGEYALLEMMKLGMIIDIDHMGMKSTEMALHWAEVFKGGYPVNLGHNGLRQNDEHHHATERNADAATIRRVAKLQGMFGLGTGDLTPDEFIEEYNKVVKAIEGLNMIDALQGRTQLYGALAVGTDANGLEPLPRATAGLDSAAFYSNGFKKLDTAGGAAKGGKTWDYTKEGVAHYGLMNEFMRDVKARNKDQNVYKRVWDSAEYFARMWEKCESLSDK